MFYRAERLHNTIYYKEIKKTIYTIEIKIFTVAIQYRDFHCQSCGGVCVCARACVCACVRVCVIKKIKVQP